MHLSYDAVGNLTGYCDGNGTVNYGYDNADELTSIQQPGGNCSATPVTGACTLISYVDANGKYQDGRRTKITFPPSTGVVETLGYDNDGNLTSISGLKGSSALSSFTYTYNNGSNDLDQRQSMKTFSGTTYYHYDGYGRLCYYAPASSGNACSSPPAGATSFSYDADGNRISMVSGSTTTSYAYNAADELCASSTSGAASCQNPNYSWDADGNMLSNPTITSLVYNAKNQTVSRTYSGHTQTLSYADADQTERVSEGNVTEAWSPLGLSEEINGYGTFYFLRDNQGSPIGEYHNGNAYFLTDGLGSITNVFDSTGTVTKTYSYDPFGNVTESGSGTFTDLRYADGFWDKASSNPGSPPLYQIGTRSYDATTGRWTQQDPIAGQISDPATINGYDYAGDDPINNVDPSGMCWTGFCWASHVWGAVKKHENAISCGLFAVGVVAGVGELYVGAREGLAVARAIREGEQLRRAELERVGAVGATSGLAFAANVATGGCAQAFGW